MTDPRVSALATLTFGSPFEGGFFAGYIMMADGVYGIVASPKASGEHRGEWGKRGKDVAGARSYFDCRGNTLAMAEAGSELAQKIVSLSIGGFSDWAIPSRDVLEVIYRNLKPTTRENYAGFRDGDNPSSVPVGYPYTAESPAQTAAEAFREGGTETFESEWYCASTQFSGAHAWVQGFRYGGQYYYGKSSTFFARAVRRFKA